MLGGFDWTSQKITEELGRFCGISCYNRHISFSKRESRITWESVSRRERLNFNSRFQEIRRERTIFFKYVRYKSLIRGKSETRFMKKWKMVGTAGFEPRISRIASVSFKYL